MSRAKLYYLHQGLPRQGPGTDASTRDAIHRLGIIRSNPRILDIGCGPGRASVLLAQELQARKWIERKKHTREVRVTDAGEAGLASLGVKL